ncbi:phytanoyl-CoA dioxygenase family protein [Bauldia sp.]|uniref:phytanoyl-CoA dioxygenase family protein n=1 Tax=Bauldia sp. TaxID=2575872 RepID=UPI003BAAFE0C
MTETLATDATVKAIDDDGVAVVRGVIDAAQCDRLIAAVEDLRADPGPHFRTLSPEGAPLVQSDLFRWRDHPEFEALVTKGPLPQLAAAIFGSDAVVLLEDQYFYSAAGSGTPSPWHQDHPYHPLEPWFLTIWIPLDPVPGETGLRTVPKSHQGPTYAPVEFSAGKATLTDDANVLAGVPAIDDDPVAFPVMAPSFAPGDAMLLDSRALHAAGGHCASTFRRLSIRYAAADTRYTARDWPVASFWDDHDVAGQLGQRIAGHAFPVIPT